MAKKDAVEKKIEKKPGGKNDGKSEALKLAISHLQEPLRDTQVPRHPITVNKQGRNNS